MAPGFFHLLPNGTPLSSLTSIVATTELQAVNALLRAVGESPVASVDDNTATDVVMAVETLRDTCREVQSRGWKFNTEFGLAISPTVSNQSWTDPDGTVQTLGVYLPPAGLSSFEVTPCDEQMGSEEIDVVVRPSKVYSPVGTLVFYDRANNRDGFPVSERTLLYIDAVWYFDFEKLPETARRAIVAVASRRYADLVLGSGEIASRLERDEVGAMISLQKDQGIKDRYNMLDNPTLILAIGNRPALRSRTPRYRVTP